MSWSDKHLQISSFNFQPPFGYRKERNAKSKTASFKNFSVNFYYMATSHGKGVFWAPKSFVTKRDVASTALCVRDPGNEIGQRLKFLQSHHGARQFQNGNTDPRWSFACCISLLWQHSYAENLGHVIFHRKTPYQESSMFRSPQVATHVNLTRVEWFLGDGTNLIQILLTRILLFWCYTVIRSS